MRMAEGTETVSDQDDATPSSFSIEVGQRLRAVRRLRQMSLDDVERASGGRWSASAIGAYERGFRNLSLPRLHELADFFQVPMSVLLGEEPVESIDRAAKIVLDLNALAGVPDAEAVLRYARSIILERGDYNGRVLSIRRDDLRAICSLMQTDERAALKLLDEWGALLDSPGTIGQPGSATG
jgi:transcriptional regulator with XRE-family HTH domain